MGLFDFFKNKGREVKEPEIEQLPPGSQSNANFGEFIGNNIHYNPIVYDLFDGEKTPGELGDIYDTYPNHLGLRLRAYDMNLKTDLVKIITGKFFSWVVGSGLKLQSEPNEVVLGMRGFDEDFPKFRKELENLFQIYSESKYSDYYKRNSLHANASEAFKTSFLGGDCLCVIRVDKFGPNIQVIDGQQVENPFDESEKGEDNTIKNGIELDKSGKHVAYWVVKEKDDSEVSHMRIKAENSNGNKIAWMIYGDKARIDHHRGIPRISSIIEKISKLDRFVEASVTKAEQGANVVYAFKHKTNSTGENILSSSLSSRIDSNVEKEDIYEKNGRTAHKLQQSVSGAVLNLTPDSELTSVATDSNSTFNDFFRAVFCALCASVDIPEEVALQKYEQNYSSSRAAINGWEHIVEVYRKRFAKDFYEPFYRFWMEFQILSDNIDSKGFLTAKMNGDFMAMEAYYYARFTGKKMPHIDPLKEAKALRSLLGENTDPLISREQAAELMGAGDWYENFKKFEEEQKLIPKEDVIIEDKNE